MNIDQIGYSIRNMRKVRGITLKEMAGKTGLSIGYLSNVERNLCSPTLQNIQKICESLGTSLGDLLERSDKQQVIVRRKEREISIDEDNMRVETIDFGIPNHNFLVMELDSADGTSMKWCHDFIEVGTVIAGVMRVEMENKSFILEEGDSIMIKAGVDHCCYNISTVKPCTSYWSRIWVITPV